MKNLLTVLLISGFIVACGGESGESVAVTPPTGSPGDVKPVDPVDPTEPKVPEEPKTEEELLQERLVIEYNLPPEPDPDVNNSTINGVDVNNNLIRDDWERAIVFTYHDRPTMMNLHNEYAIKETKINLAFDLGDESVYGILDEKGSEIIYCSHYLNDDGMGNDGIFDKMPNNTYERWRYRSKRDSAVTKVVGAGIFGTPDSILAEVCPKYQK